jgi:PPIC-type PPIASE domain
MRLSSWCLMATALLTPVRRLLREPLLHFCVAGAVLFAAFLIAGAGAGPAIRDIDVTRGQVLALAADFERTWSRPPTRAELEALVDAYLQEEILYREARSAGLDEGDPVIRLRLNQKMELLTGDVVAALEPDDADLASFAAAHASELAAPEEIELDQIFLGLEGRADAGTVAALLTRLRTLPDGADWRALGQRISLPAQMGPAAADEITRVFGAKFASALADLEIGVWSGPVQSGFGEHLVRLRSRRAAMQATLDSDRDEIVSAWREWKRVELDRAYMDAVRTRYRLHVDWPDSGGD